MNKYIIIIIVAVLLIGGGIAYRVFLLPSRDVPVVSGQTKEFTVTATKDQWAFEPADLEVNRGDRVVLHVVNNDDYDHGIAIDAYGISQRMPASKTITVEFVATQAGEFPFYCSVPCGDGVVDGKKRGHFDMVGKVKVKDLVQTQ